MITPHFFDVPCPCGRSHHLPADPTGRIMWICGAQRRIYTLRLNADTFAREMARTPIEKILSIEEGVCVVHKAGPPVHYKQRCEDCGWLLISYHFFKRLFPFARDIFFWPPGSLVGQTATFDCYLAQVPLTTHRERRCYQKAAH